MDRITASKSLGGIFDIQVARYGNLPGALSHDIISLYKDGGCVINCEISMHRALHVLDVELSPCACHVELTTLQRQILNTRYFCDIELASLTTHCQRMVLTVDSTIDKSPLGAHVGANLNIGLVMSHVQCIALISGNSITNLRSIRFGGIPIAVIKQEAVSIVQNQRTIAQINLADTHTSALFCTFLTGQVVVHVAVHEHTRRERHHGITCDI